MLCSWILLFMAALNPFTGHHCRHLSISRREKEGNRLLLTEPRLRGQRAAPPSSAPGLADALILATLHSGHHQGRACQALSQETLQEPNTMFMPGNMSSGGREERRQKGLT